MPGRKFAVGTGYRYGFNGKEKDKDIANDDYDYGERIYDGRLGRWLSMDPLQKKYPNETHYAFVSNSPLLYIDPDGRDKIVTLTIINKDGSQIKIKSVNSSYSYTQINPGYYETTFSKFDVTSDIVIDYSKPDSKGKPTGRVTTDIVRSTSKDINMFQYVAQNMENAITDGTPIVKEFGYVLSGNAAGDGHTLDLGGFSNKAELLEIGNLMQAAGNLREYSGKLEIMDFGADAAAALKLNYIDKVDKILTAADNVLDGAQAAIDAKQISTNTKQGTTEQVKATMQKPTPQIKTTATKGKESKSKPDSIYVWKHDGDSANGTQNMRKVVNPQAKKKGG